VVQVENPSEHLAFFLRLAITRDTGGDEVTPTYWDDNYFCLLPGEKREVKARFSPHDLGGDEAIVKIDGWNIE